MAKIKTKKNADMTIWIIMFLMKGKETIAYQELETTTNVEEIGYEDIKKLCQEFLQKEDITYETNIYTPDLNNLKLHNLVNKDYKFNVNQLAQKMSGSLFLIITSVYQELKEDLENQVSFLKKELDDLKRKIQQLLPIKQNIQLLKKNSVSHSPLLISAQSMVDKDSQNLELDIAVLFSEPLYDDQKKKPTLPAVDFRSEISRLNISLQGAFKPSIVLRCEIATIESLKNTIKYSKPKILHIICHGNSQGFLEFQDDSRNTLGVLQLLKSQDIKAILKNLTELLPQLVFVNSCHSEQVGKAFYQLGVKNVIMINSQDLISDEAAQIFSESFYRNIFHGESVMDSFLSAKKKVQINHIGGCCCAHSALQPHRENCRWLKLMRRYPNAHKDYHVPSAKCQCQLRNFNRHNVQCEWARKVLFELNDDFRIPIEGTSQFRFPQFIGEFPDYYDRDKKQLVVCCCPIKGRKPHSESIKFIILAKDEGKYPLFHITHNRGNPQITDTTSIQLQQAHEKSKAIFGRQRQLYQFLKAVKQINFIVLYGKTGTGLTSFAIKASNYMVQRRAFEYFLFIDLYDIKDQTVFRYKFNEITNFKYNGRTINEIGMKNRKVLLLFDNCDDFINGSPAQFYKEIQTILRQLPRCKIIITFKEQTLQLFDDKKIMCKKFELAPFQTRYAISFLNNKLKDKTDISVGYQQFRKLVNQYEVLKIPKVIESLSQSFSEKQKRLTYEQIEKNVIGIKVSDTNKLTQSVLNQLKQKSQEAFEFLVFVSQFSDGISYDDLNIFSYYSRKDLSVQLPIQKNWQEHYLLLFEKDKDKETEASQSDREDPKLTATVSNTDARQNSLSEDKSPSQPKKLQMKKRESDAAASSDNNSKCQLDNIKGESYFVDSNGKGRFIVKRFIRDFVWKKYANETTNQMKFLFVAYFSVILEMLFDTLKRMNYVHQDLTTYSTISNAGIFSFSTTLEETYEKRALTKSARFAKQLISDLDFIFIKNQQLVDKIKNADPSTFIMNHRHDFLKIYDNNWSEVYKHLEKKKAGEERVFIVLLESLMIYIPTALKIAKAEDSLLRYVLKSSAKQLLKTQEKTKPERNLKLQLKVCLIEIGISLDMQKQLDQCITRANKIIDDFLVRQNRNQQIATVCTIFKEELFTLDLLKDLLKLKIENQSEVGYLINRKDQYLATKENATLQPIIKAKQGLLLSLLFLKFMIRNPMQMRIYLKSQSSQLKEQILTICATSSLIFKDKQCKKLQLKAQLCQLELFWEFNERYDQKSIDSKSYEEIDKWRLKLTNCEQIYLNSKYRLRGFTEFDNKIKMLKQEIKQKLWKSASKRIIFMKAYPLATREHYPIIKNLVRRKNNFRKEIETILSENVKQNMISQKKLPSYNSPSLKPKQSRVMSERKIQLDISTKYEILTREKILQEARARCSIMYLTVDIRVINEKIYMVTENQIMEEELIEVNLQLAKELNFDNILILVLSGVNTSKAMRKIGELSLKPPIIIALHSEPVENYDEIDYSHEFDTDSIRQLIKKENEIKEAEIAYTKHFIKKVTQSIISSNEDIKNIHYEALDKMITESNTKRVKALIQIHDCNKNIHLQYTEGVYRDLSPGYERNNNIDQKYYQNNVLMRRWRKMIEFFKFLRKEGLSRPSLGMNDNILGEPKNLFLSVNYNEQHSRYPESGTYINVYGQNGCGKTFFIRQLAKILVEREFYDFGVFLFEGKKIQNSYGGDFQAYIRKQASTSKMPVFEDFEKLLGEKTILIVDDFHLIKPRVNARMKIFMDKILSKKVNLILVSVNELKLEFLPGMKKIKIEYLDNFETEVLAYHIININNPQQIHAYNLLKQSCKKKNRPPLIQEIDSCRRGKLNMYSNDLVNEFCMEVQNRNMKKHHTSLG